MKIIYKFILLLTFFGSLFAQNEKVLFKIESPEFVPTGKTFTLSTILKIDEYNLDSLSFIISTQKYVELDSARLNYYDNRSVTISKIENFGDFENSYQLNLFKNDSTLIENIGYQIICYLSNNVIGKSSIDFEFPNFAQNADAGLDEFSVNNGIANIEFYSPGKLSGNCLSLKNNSDFELTFKPNSYDDFLIEFWLKSDRNVKQFFNCINNYSNDTLISLRLGEFNSLTTNSWLFKEYVDEKYISKNTWNHVVIHFDNDDGRILVYSDGKFLFSTELTLGWFENEFVLKFLNNSSDDKNIKIDQLRIWNFKDHLSTIFENRNYSFFNADSSTLISNFTFENSDFLFNETDFFYVDYNDVEFEVSDAPIFSQAPIVNIDKYNSYFNINWKVKDEKLASYFIVEKSTEDGIYKEIYRTDYSSGNSIYSISDSKVEESGIIYYRVIQVNSDGSEISSLPSKIGRGKLVYFNLDQNYPNPFNPLTSIKIEIFYQTEIEINVYDLVGNNISKLYKGVLAKGEYSFDFDGSDLPSGIYFYEAKTPTSSSVQKMILAK